MIIGTAGHIDHGKSTLVTALTGTQVDRLPEERRREITIDLNFAPLELGSSRTAGIVDVPGHEDFVRTMVAGASGIDLALLVIAADEGIMPQTEEHLLILEQLGVVAGIPVLTKADLAAADWLELVTQDVSERLQASSISFDPPMTVSARTGEGLESLRRRLVERSKSVAPRSAGDAFRMPIDRVFSLPGIGTVVTGTAWSGRLEIGDTARTLPSELRGRVRSLESYGRAIPRSEPGARTAVGLAGIERSQLARGHMLVTDELPWTATSALDAEITLDRRAARRLTQRARVRLLLGTAEVMARVYPQTPIAPGERGFARLKLESPLVARGQDRFVLRSYSPVTTIGGGKVVDPQPGRRRALWSPGLASFDAAERFQALLERRPGGISAPELPILLGLPRGTAADFASRHDGARLLGDLWVSEASLEAVASRALATLRGYHREHPDHPGMSLETLRHSLGEHDSIVDGALAKLSRTGRIRRSETIVALAGFAPRITGGDAEIDRIVNILAQAHLTPPSVTELERSTGHRDLYPLLRLAAANGRVEAVERDRYYAREALEQFRGVLLDLGNHGTILPAAVRDRLGISRKYLIPLLEWADGQGITVREGDNRRLRRKV